MIEVHIAKFAMIAELVLSTKPTTTRQQQE